MLLRNKYLFMAITFFSFNVLAFEEGYASNGDTKIAYRDYGPASGKPILLVTGLGAQLTLWPQFLIDDLQANSFRPIVFDNRDVGLSTRFSSKPSQLINYLKYFLFIPVTSEYSIEDMALDGISVLDKLEIEKSHILGMSMGGMISQVLVANHPSRIETFTLISSTASTPNPLNGPKFKVTRQMLKRTAAQDDIEGRIDQSIKLFELIGTPGKTYDTPQFRSDMRSYIKRGGDDSGFLRQMAAIIGSKNRKKLVKSIKSPTLIIHGDIDPLIKVKNAYSSHKLIKSSELVIVDGMGHLLDESSYQQFQPRLMQFLKS
jgi:pimeloyl-ACP methyl ester carboxylesterase